MVSGPRTPRDRSLLRRNVIVAASTTAAVALLLSYHTSLNAGGAAASAAPSAALGSSAAAAAAATGTASPAAGSTTVTGDSVDTRFGPVQVQITVQDGRIVAADAVVSPDGDGRSVEINARAVPLLDQQAVAAQSAAIDGVSGATYTSNAYTQSLQSAIDQMAAASSSATTTTPQAAATTAEAPTTSTGGAATSGVQSGTFTGASVDTRFGPVQVVITVQDGTVASADAVASPDGDGRSIEINAAAVPLLDQQAVAAQSADIDGVSGATYTSNAYAQSLQSALDQAGLTGEAAS